MILKRQKLALAALSASPAGYLSERNLLAILFQLQSESSFEKVGSPYDFLQLNQFPFSYQALHELERLAENDILIRLRSGYQISSKFKAAMISDLPLRVRELARTVTQSFVAASSGLKAEIVDQNTEKWRTRRPRIQKTIKYSTKSFAGIRTIGYQDLSIDCFLSTILTENVDTIVDVRANPISRKYGFSYSALKWLCNACDVSYVHLPELGISSSIRRSHLSRRHILERYYQDLDKSHSVLSELGNLAMTNRIALLCYEMYPHDCHREKLAHYISEITNYPVFHYSREDRVWQRESGFLLR
jgi:uncharacterized protein (DUF488 family)